MRKLHPLAVALPAFLLGCLATASLTSVAHAQDKPDTLGRAEVYHIVTDEATMNRYAKEGYEVKQSNATVTYVWYLMQRYR